MLIKYKTSSSKHIETIYENEFDNSSIEKAYSQAKPISKALFTRVITDSIKSDKYSEFKRFEGYYFLVNSGNGFKKDIIEVYYDTLSDHILDLYNPEYKSTTKFKFHCSDLQFKKIFEIAQKLKNNPDDFENLKKILNVSTKGIKFETI